MLKRRPFYSYPQERLNELLHPMAISIRSLPDDQLATETEELVAACAAPGLHLPETILLTLYRAETERRADPEQKRDDELDEVLSRLERQTTAEDRQTAVDIGRELYRVGGAPCLLRARDRMLARAKPERRDLRAMILAKRWKLDVSAA